MSAAPLGGVAGESAGIPPLAFVGFQAVFAIITVALISGAIADRAKFGAWMVFAGVWATVVYFPVAHWVFAFDGYTGATGGWIANNLKAIDFAGGTAVHINAGAAGLALALVLGKRIGFGKEADAPAQPAAGHDRRRPAVVRLVRLQRRLGARRRQHRRGRLDQHHGRHRGRLARLARHREDPGRSRHLAGRRVRRRRRPGRHHPGLLVGEPGRRDRRRRRRRCALRPGRGLKYKFGYDDSLDVVGVHLVGGLVGTLLIGILATDKAPAGVNGLFYGGGVDQLWRQAVAAGAVLAFSFVLAYVIGTVIDKTIGFRVDEEAEVTGIDLKTHAESAYELGSFSGSGFHTGAGVGSTKERVDA